MNGRNQGLGFKAVLSATAALLALAGVGCSDDDATPAGTDAGVDSGVVDGSVATDSAVPIVCPPMAPAPDNQMGSCCSRRSNSDRQTAPEFRLAGIRITSPSTLGNTLIGNLLASALDQERFNWLIQITGAPAAGTAGEMTIKTGFGARTTEGTFTFMNGTAPGPGSADRWNAVTVTGDIDATEEMHGDLYASTLTLPIFTSTGEISIELPIQGLTLERADLTEERSCIGRRRPSSYSDDAGALSAYLTVEATRMGMINLGSVTSTLCTIIAGTSPGTCDNTAQSDWSVKPDSLCDGTGCRQNMAGMTDVCNPTMSGAGGCNAWKLVASFAAQGVEITN